MTWFKVNFFLIKMDHSFKRNKQYLNINYGRNIIKFEIFFNIMNIFNIGENKLQL